MCLCYSPFSIYADVSCFEPKEDQRLLLKGKLTQKYN